MVMVWGTRRKRYPIGFFRAPCARCGVVTDHLRVWEKVAAHVWYIPFIPLKSRRYVVCGGCGTVKPDHSELDGVPVGGVFGMPAQGGTKSDEE